MLAEPPLSLSPTADIVYAKTEGGRAELAQRCLGLTARQRSVLIMLDGRKSTAALGLLMPAAQLADILAALAQLQLIAPAAPSAPTLSNDIDDAHLAPVKLMLVRAAQTYLGPLATDLVDQIKLARDEHQLQRAIGHWHMAMRDSKYGRQVADAQLALVRESLQAPPSVAA